MMTREDNEMMCRVGAETPMGKMLRRYWHPVMRSQRLKADGDPIRVRLLGENFVAFRTTDGQVGLLDEGCPHRCTSLALARHEGDGLRCIFHGWKIGVDGRLLDVPTEQPENVPAFAARIRARSYPVKEAGGLIWAFIDSGEPAKFPDMEFTHLPDDHVDIHCAIIHCNWVQGLEAVIDSAHLGILHSSSGMQHIVGVDRQARPVRFEFVPTPYGFREAAIREMKDGRRHMRIREFIAPYSSFPPSVHTGEGSCLGAITVPMDDEWCAQYWVAYNWRRPLIESDHEFVMRFMPTDRDNFYVDRGTPENLWGQDREAMRKGFWSGFPKRTLLHEDFVVQEAMGAIVDRSRENLSNSDMIIVQARRQLLDGMRRFLEGGKPWGQNDDIDFSRIRSVEVIADASTDWRKIDSFEEAARVLREAGVAGLASAAE